MLETVEKHTGQGAVYHGMHDAVRAANGKVCAFCELCLGHPATAPLCRYACCSATMHAISSGEPHYQRCWAGLLFVVVPIAPKDVCRGGVEMGGFFSEGESEEAARMVTERLSPWYREDVGEFLAHLDSLREITPSALRGLGSFLMEATFSEGLNSPAFFRRQNRKYLQQREIAEAFVDLQVAQASPPDILGDTYQLIRYLDRQDRDTAMHFVSRYLARLLLASKWNLTRLKAHMRVLLAVMTSEEILRGAEWAASTARELRYMTRLERAETTEDSCYEIAEMILEHFDERRWREDGTGSVAERATAWLQLHYHESADLAALAKAVGASVSSVVHHLREETGKTSRQLLREIRIAEAKKLLATTSMEVSEVAAQCGFFDQSHFTRAFRESINLTPGQFRKLLVLPRSEVLS